MNGIDPSRGIGMVSRLVVLWFISIIIVVILLSNFSSNCMGSKANLEMSCMLRDSRHNQCNDG